MSTKLRVLALMHRHLIPPAKVEEGTDITSAPVDTNSQNFISFINGGNRAMAINNAANATTLLTRAMPETNGIASPLYFSFLFSTNQPSLLVSGDTTFNGTLRKDK